MEYKACVFSMYASRNSGPPAWIVFLAGVALIFGLYYVWLGVRDFLANGPAPLNATQQAEQQLTVAFEQAANQSVLPTSRPTLTPQPTCQRYTVRVEEVNVRTGPDVSADFIEKRAFGTEICVIGLEGDTTWFLIDMDPESRRIDPGYIRSDLLEAANPSPTPSVTQPPAPTITLTPSNTPTATPTMTYTPTRTPRPRATSTG